MAFLKEFFDDRIILTWIWPPMSLGLSPPDFYLYGMLKSMVYINDPKNLNQLKDNISKGIQKIQVSELQHIFRNMIKRKRLCLQYEERHFQHRL